MPVQQMPARQQPGSENDTHDLGRLFGRKTPTDDEQERSPEQQQGVALVMNPKSPAQAPPGQYECSAEKRYLYGFARKKTHPREREQGQEQGDCQAVQGADQ